MDSRNAKLTDHPLFIAVPAWGAAYVDLAIRYTIPAALAALAEVGREATWIIHTDNQAAFRNALSGHQRHMTQPPVFPNARDHWQAFKQAHHEAIELTPDGGLLTLLNADTVVSREMFAAVIPALRGKRKVGVSIGIRTVIDGNHPPVGANAETLAQWIWTHRHSITEETIWGRGRSRLPTVLFFMDGSSVSFHSFHLTPMWVVKDRKVNFAGTIDDDLLENYSDDEICYFTDRQFVIAELSPRSKQHPTGLEPMDVRSVVQWATLRIKRPSHFRNFKQRFTLLGKPNETHPAALSIMACLP